MYKIFMMVLLMTPGTQALAECKNLCERTWWLRATTADVYAELDAGADVMARTEDGWTPLHVAARRGTPENIEVLLAAGADVMARDEDGNTPLHSAAGRNAHAGVIEALLEARADPKAKNTGGTTPWDIAQLNDQLKGTKGYWALNEARFR